MSGERCTWVIEAHYKTSKTILPDEEREIIPDHQCGKLAVVDYKRTVKKKGTIPFIEHNVRCRTHATPAAALLAVITGYEEITLNGGVISVHDYEEDSP